MTHHLIFGCDEQLIAWAEKRIPHMGRTGFGPAKAVGIASGTDGSARLLAVVVYHMYIPEYRTCQMSVASASPRWASRNVFREVLAPPFVQYRINKAWSAVPHTNERVIRFAEAIGFKREAVLRDHFGPGVHAVILRMLARDYERQYLKGRKIEKTETKRDMHPMNGSTPAEATVH